jgi:hypothetical protein
LPESTRLGLGSSLSSSDSTYEAEHLQPRVNWAKLHAARAQGYVYDVLTYLPSPLVEENQFLTMSPDRGPVPSFARARPHLPEPFWSGHKRAGD